MVWNPIATAPVGHPPFTVWISPFPAAGPDASTIERDCTRDPVQGIVDQNGAPVADATHWIVQ
ncbi:MAG: hypothetical protein AAGK00_00235 [Pseudomonadota bacterium]